MLNTNNISKRLIRTMYTYFYIWILLIWTTVQKNIITIWFNNKDFYPKKPTNIFLVCIIIWTMEWIIVIEYMFAEWTRANIIQAVRVPTLLTACLIYWFWLWSMAVWRRTQYGKFTRGERKLWAKSLTSFWVAELVTIGSIIFIFAWLSWGPSPLVFRIFAVSRKGIILEFIVFSYIFFLTYAAKHLLKWNSWNTQLFLCCIIICLLSYIFWKDIMLLTLRENLRLSSSTRWRNIRTNIVIYTLAHDWWTQHTTTARAPYALYDNLQHAFISKIKPNLSVLPILSQYNTNNTIIFINKDVRAKSVFPLLHYINDYASQYNLLNKYFQPTATYPRRTGFVPKRLAIWQLITILKMWHHIVLLIWWTLYAYRLLFRRKTSYAFLSSCGFNVYCCLILAGLIYLTYFFRRYELFLKFKPQHITLHRILILADSGWFYLINIILHWNQNNATPTFPIS